MRIGDYVVRPDANCWILATVKTYETGSESGKEYESDVVYPGRFDQALRTLLDRMMREGLEPCDGFGGGIHLVESRAVNPNQPLKPSAGGTVPTVGAPRRRGLVPMR